MLQRFFKRFNAKTEIERTILTLEQLDVRIFQSVYSSDMSILQIWTCVPNIVDYIALIHNLIRYMDEDVMIYSPALTDTDVTFIYMRDFWTTSDNYTVDISTTADAFITACVELLNLYQTLERQGDKTFNTDKNLLLTQHIVVNIMTITSSFTNLR